MVQMHLACVKGILFLHCFGLKGLNGIHLLTSGSFLSQYQEIVHRGCVALL